MKSFLLPVLVLLLPCGSHADDSVNCSAGKESCSKCYSTLVEQVTKRDQNLFNLQNRFFPPEKASPLFLTVYYHFDTDTDVCDTNDTSGSLYKTKDNNTVVWFWSTTSFYLFQPIHVLQYTSLFFSDSESYASEVCLVLHPDCRDASKKHMRLLTQRVSCKLDEDIL